GPRARADAYEKEEESCGSYSAASDSTGCTVGATTRLGPQRVRITLAQDRLPSTTIDAAASTKKPCALAPCVDSHQPPSAMNTSRAVCASTGPTIFAAPCDEKYIALASPMKPYHGAAVARYCRLAVSTSWSRVKILTQRSGKIAMITAIPPTEKKASDPAVQATRRARATFPPPIAMPIIGTEAMPNENDSDVSRNSSRAPMP